MYKNKKIKIVLCSRTDCNKTDCPNFASYKNRGVRYDYKDCLHHPEFNSDNKRVKSYT